MVTLWFIILSPKPNWVVVPVWDRHWYSQNQGSNKDHTRIAVCKSEISKHLEARRPVKVLLEYDIGW